MNRLRNYGIALVLIGTTLPAMAGTACSEAAPTPESVRKGLNLALQTREALDASGAEIALVARVGQDLSKYGLRYSHVGFAWRDHPDGRWLVVHQLNECGTAASNLYDQGLGNFFNDDLFAWEAMIIVPSPEAQAKLVQALKAPRVDRLHNPNYNMLAYPFSTKYQNSNQWLLEMLNEGYQVRPAANRDMAQAWLKVNGYQPTRLNLPTMTRLGARMFRANIAFDDHPDELRWNDKIDTITVDSVATYVRTIDPAARSTVVTLN